MHKKFLRLESASYVIPAEAPYISEDIQRHFKEMGYFRTRDVRMILGDYNMSDSLPEVCDEIHDVVIECVK